MDVFCCQSSWLPSAKTSEGMAGKKSERHFSTGQKSPRKHVAKKLYIELLDKRGSFADKSLLLLCKILGQSLFWFTRKWRLSMYEFLSSAKTFFAIHVVRAWSLFCIKAWQNKEMEKVRSQKKKFKRISCFRMCFGEEKCQLFPYFYDLYDTVHHIWRAARAFPPKEFTWAVTFLAASQPPFYSAWPQKWAEGFFFVSVLATNIRVGRQMSVARRGVTKSRWRQFGAFFLSSCGSPD